MKRFFWILIAAALLTACKEEVLIIPDQPTHIPELPELTDPEELPLVNDVMEVIDDPYFARYCLVRFDTNGDGKLSMAEAERAERIIYDEDTPEQQADYSRFISMKGIEYFKNLEALEVRSSVLTELDLSHNSNLKELRFSLAQGQCHLKRLNVSHTDLEELVIPSSELEELQVSGSRLKRLTIYTTEQHLKSLDVRYCEELETLEAYNCAFPSLDLRYCPRLRTLRLFGAKLQTLDLSQNAALETLELMRCGLNSISLKNNKKLAFLDLSSNSLYSIDLSALSELVSLVLSENPITSIDISKNEKLRSLGMDSTAISTLNTDNNNELNTLTCDNAKLTKLDLSTNSRLELLSCSGNQLSELNITPRVGGNLKALHCANNRFVSLDLSTLTLTNWSKEMNHDFYANQFAPQPHLEVLTLSETTQQVDIEQFSGCPKLRKVILHATEVPELFYEGEITPSGATLYVPSEAIASDQNSDWAKAFAEVRSL